MCVSIGRMTACYGDKPGFFFSIQFPGYWWRFALFCRQRGFKSFLHKSFANVINRLEVAMKIVGYFLVRFLRFIFVGI